MASELPVNTVKRIIKEHWDGEISQECVKKLGMIVSDFVDELIKEGVEEFNKHNRLREIQKLPKLKRLDVSIFKNLSTNVYNSVTGRNNGEIGQNNSDTIFLKADENEVV